MNDYPLESGQRMIIRPNNFEKYSKLGHKLICLGKVISTKTGVVAKNCTWSDEENNLNYITIPLVLLWRIADDENLLEYYESTLIH